LKQQSGIARDAEPSRPTASERPVISAVLSLVKTLTYIARMVMRLMFTVMIVSAVGFQTSDISRSDRYSIEY